MRSLTPRDGHLGRFDNRDHFTADLKAELIDEDWLKRNLPGEALTIGYKGNDTAAAS